MCARGRHLLLFLIFLSVCCGEVQPFIRVQVDDRIWLSKHIVIDVEKSTSSPTVRSATFAQQLASAESLPAGFADLASNRVSLPCLIAGQNAVFFFKESAFPRSRARLVLKPD